MCTSEYFYYTYPTKFITGFFSLMYKYNKKEMKEYNDTHYITLKYRVKFYCSWSIHTCRNNNAVIFYN